MIEKQARHVRVANHLFTRCPNQQPATSTTTSRIECQLQEAVLQKDLRRLPGGNFLHDHLCQFFTRRSGECQARCQTGHEKRLEVATHRSVGLNNQFPEVGWLPRAVTSTMPPVTAAIVCHRLRQHKTLPPIPRNDAAAKLVAPAACAQQSKT